MEDEYKINDNLLKYNFFQTYHLSNPKNEYAIASGYLDIYKDNLIIGTGDGIFLKFKLKNLNTVRGKEFNNFFAEKIETNFREIVYTDVKYKYLDLALKTGDEDTLFSILSVPGEIMQNKGGWRDSSY